MWPRYCATLATSQSIRLISKQSTALRRTLYPKGGPATRNRRVHTPISAISEICWTGAGYPPPEGSAGNCPLADPRGSRKTACCMRAAPAAARVVLIAHRRPDRRSPMARLAVRGSAPRPCELPQDQERPSSRRAIASRPCRRIGQPAAPRRGRVPPSRWEALPTPPERL